ncbi:sel1 repeat family protein, partial [bacterium]|nr:sel1 repeat family protein [bacterium]
MQKINVPILNRHVTIVLLSLFVLLFFGCTENPQSAEEQYKLGIKYIVEENLPKAMKYFTKAAEQGHAEAQYKLGLCYCQGFIFDRKFKEDYPKAEEWFKKSAAQGNMKAQCELAVCYGKNNKEYSKAIELLNKSAKQGYARAKMCLGLAYCNGEGVEKDVKKGVAYFQEAAKEGDDVAQFNLAIRYFQGKDGLKKDYAQAIKWLTESAEQGNGDAQCLLAACYREGKGVEKDEKKADELVIEAAEYYNKIALEYVKERVKSGDKPFCEL